MRAAKISDKADGDPVRGPVGTGSPELFFQMKRVQ
jgi:hypothetical protein